MILLPIVFLIIRYLKFVTIDQLTLFHDLLPHLEVII